MVQMSVPKKIPAVYAQRLLVLGQLASFMRQLDKANTSLSIREPRQSLPPSLRSPSILPISSFGGRRLSEKTRNDLIPTLAKRKRADTSESLTRDVHPVLTCSFGNKRSPKHSFAVHPVSIPRAKNSSVCASFNLAREEVKLAEMAASTPVQMPQVQTIAVKPVCDPMLVAKPAEPALKPVPNAVSRPSEPIIEPPAATKSISSKSGASVQPILPICEEISKPSANSEEIQKRAALTAEGSLARVSSNSVVIPVPKPSVRADNAPVSSLSSKHLPHSSKTPVPASSFWRSFLRWLLRRSRKKGRRGTLQNRRERRRQVHLMLWRFHRYQLKHLSRRNRGYVIRMHYYRRHTLREVLGRYVKSSRRLRQGYY